MNIAFEKKDREKLFAAAAVVLLLLYGIAGLFLYDDYGCGPDEGMERWTSMVTLKYVLRKLNIPVSEERAAMLEEFPDLKEYRDRYYGTALHQPVALIEYFSGFRFEPIQFYGMRHLYTFLNYFAGTVCFYLLLSRRFGSRKFGLIGMLMMILTPRFFAESFYNNKDVIFMVWYIICAYFMSRWFDQRNAVNSVLLAFVTALACNTRFNAIVYIAAFVFLFLFDAFRTRRFTGTRFLILTLVLTAVFFYLITPNFWENPFGTLIETLKFNMRHPNHGSEGNLFKGIPVDAARTYTYIPVWIALTVPTVYLIFSVLGSILFLGEAGYLALGRKFERIDLTDGIMFISGYAAAAFIILAHVTIYNGWRHCYFMFPCLIYFAVRFFRCMEKRSGALIRGILYALLGAALVYNGFWIARNHPFEYVYFAPWARGSAVKYSGDYWGISSRALFEYITDTDPERMLLINHANTQAGSINRGLLPKDKRKYIELTYEDSEDVDYYIVCRDDKPDTDIGKKEYEKVFSIIVDSDEIGSVYKKIN